MNLTVSRHVNQMRITNKASVDQRRKRTKRKETIAFDGGANERRVWMDMAMVVEGAQKCKLFERFAHEGAEVDCTCTGWLLSPFSRQQCVLHQFHRPVNRRGAAREHSVFGRHNANASIILDDRRLISYCREGRRARAGIISGRDVASRSKFRNFAKWASLSAPTRANERAARQLQLLTLI